MSILRTHNLQNPDSSTINIVMDQGGNTNITGVTTVGGSNFHVPSGSVGIGTDAPGAKLEVRDGNSQGIIIRSNSTQATDTNKALRVRNNSDTNTFHVSHKGQGYFAGRIGIGTDNPDRHLHLRRVDNSAIGIKLQNNEGTASILADSDALELYSDTTVLRSEAGTERVRLNSTGFGIGVSPQQKLDVVGSAHTVAVFRPDTSSVSAYGDASVVNNLVNLRMPYGSNPGSQTNNGARWGIKFQGRNDGAEYGTDAGKSASIYGVSEDATAGYNRKVGLSFYTSPFDASQAERLRITSDGHLIVGAGYADFQSGTRGEASSTNPYKLVFQNQYSNGHTDEKLKLYLFNSGATRQGFGPGPSYDLQYHCSGGTNQAKHRFYTDNVLRMEIADAHGAITKPTQPSFHATNTTIGQINTDFYGIIVFNDVTSYGNHNIGSHYNASTGVFTAPIAGRYLICARTLTNSSANSNTYVSIFVRQNGNIIGYLGHNHTDSWIMECYSGVLSLAANDTVDVYVNQASAHGAQNYASFSGHLLS